MKIIDFDRKGNVVRFYLGRDDCSDYWGDDWNDYPYDCNAGRVYDEFVIGYVDMCFPFGCSVLEPCDGDLNCNYSKEDMKTRLTPCLIVVPEEICKDSWCDTFCKWVGTDGITKYYFGDKINIYDDHLMMVKFKNGYIKE